MTRTRLLAITSMLAYVTWYLLPQVEWRWMSDDVLLIISYSGFGSALELSNSMAWGTFAVMMIAYVGVIAFGRKIKVAFLVVIGLFMIVLTPFSGINAETGLSIAIRDISNILLGALLLSLFFPGRAPQTQRRPERE